MPATKIMIIRHAEKPPDDNSASGVSETGQTDKEDLTVAGWQRAGALVRFFAPFQGAFAHPALVTPTAIFASRVEKHSSSLRPQHTIAPLARFLGVNPNLNHPKGDEKQLAADALSTKGAVLIAWEHHAIPAIVDHLTNNSVPFPQTWPDARFDLVWILNRPSETGPWTFTQVPQMLLAGDKSDPVPLS
jgi:hypothetical protein